MSEKWGLSHRNPEKMGPFIYFLMKKGGQSYTWQCWKRGLFGTHIRTMPLIGSYSPPPQPPSLDALAEWEARWGMAFHPQKCSVLSVSRARSPIRYPYKLKGHTLETEDATKYLGVDLQTTLSWKTHIDRISKKVNSMLDLDATFGLVARTQKPTPTSAWCGQTWNIAHLFETHIKKNSSGSLRWYYEELPEPPPPLIY